MTNHRHGYRHPQSQLSGHVRIQHGGQMSVTCWIKQCWMALHQPVAFVWPGPKGLQIHKIVYHYSNPLKKCLVS